MLEICYEIPRRDTLVPILQRFQKHRPQRAMVGARSFASCPYNQPVFYPIDISEKCQYLSITGFQQAIAQGAVRSAQSQGANVSQSQWKNKALRQLLLRIRQN
ncbi:hypothetical protein [Scytonema sp. PCC 10023]|uniref:hypothetical protein n=1 Tax=Scytonema sp. PCC 10023 TaxID=1680591 RepID=UPI0039C74F2A